MNLVLEQNDDNLRKCILLFLMKLKTTGQPTAKMPFSLLNAFLSLVQANCFGIVKTIYNNKVFIAYFDIIQCIAIVYKQ